jgi:hypothetical protein
MNTGRTVDRPSNALLERANQNRRRRRTVYTSLVAAILLVVVLSFLAPGVRLDVRSSTSSRPLLKPEAQYQQAVNEAVRASVFNRSKLTFSDADIEDAMLKKFPELGAVRASTPVFGDKPVVTVEAAEPALELMSQNGTFVIDTTGKAVILISNLPDPSALHLPLVVDQTGSLVTLNKSVLPATEVAFIREIIAQLSAKGFKASRVTLPKAANEVDVSLQGRAYTVKFNTQSSTARQQAGTFLATIKQLQNQHTIPAQYVDVRVEGRAYYK